VRKKLLQLALFLLIIDRCEAQIIHSPVRANYIQIGAYSNNFTDAFSFINNQAALISQKQISAGVYSERRFSLQELSNYTLAIAVPTDVGGFGLQANYFGFSDYNESQLGIAYAKKLGQLISIGVQFNYYAIHISEYGNTSAVNFETGFIIHPTEKIAIGFHVYNPVGGNFGKNINEKLASIYNIGVGYEASQQVFVSAEIIKEENKPVNVNAGLQYVFAKQFFARAGIITESTSPYFGFGLHWAAFRIDATVSYHQQLGFTPGFLIIYEFKKKE
jgi:hypothetical protein